MEWIDTVTKVQQQPRHDLLVTPVELALQDGSHLCPPLRIPRNVLQSKCRGIMVAGGRGKRREAQVKAATVRKRNQLQPRYINSPAGWGGCMRKVVGGGARPGWGGSRQSLKNIPEALCQGPVKRRLGDLWSCTCRVGSDKPPTPKMSTR